MDPAWIGTIVLGSIVPILLIVIIVIVVFINVGKLCMKKLNTEYDVDDVAQHYVERTKDEHKPLEEKPQKHQHHIHKHNENKKEHNVESNHKQNRKDYVSERWSRLLKSFENSIKDQKSSIPIFV